MAALPQPGSYRLHQGAASLAAVGRAGAPGGHVAAHWTVDQTLQGGFRAKAVIGSYRIGHLTGVGLHCVEQRQQSVLVGAVVDQAMRHDDLRVGIDASLRVVGLNEAIAALYDPAFRIGEFALGRGFRLARWIAAALGLAASSDCRSDDRAAARGCFGGAG